MPAPSFWVAVGQGMQAPTQQVFQSAREYVVGKGSPGMGVTADRFLGLPILETAFSVARHALGKVCAHPFVGSSMIPQHSDARVLDQVLYKWAHSCRIIARVLRDKYGDLVDTGWAVTRAEIVRDADALLGGNFWRFLELKL